MIVAISCRQYGYQFMLKTSLLVIVSFAILSFAEKSHATDYLRIDDASQIRWLVDSSGKVYLRNLDVFDNTYLGCCYNYWIDTSTEGGKIFFSVFLARVSAGQRLWISLPDKTVPNAVSNIGDW